jgi:uncharacterized protein DUF5752
MTTSGLGHPASQVAAKPFQFASAASLIRIEREQARNLVQLLNSLRSCSEASIFHHTFQTLEEHHFIREGLTNDFAQWVYADLSEAELAEQLGGIDVRSFTSVGALREQLVSTVGGYLQQNPFASERPAFKPFYFCSPQTVLTPTPFVAHNLAEFIDAMQKVSIHTIHHHFIDARLRLKLASNDFSVWLETELGLKRAAALLNRIDIYTSTLDDVRRQILRVLRAASA